MEDGRAKRVLCAGSMEEVDDFIREYKALKEEVKRLREMLDDKPSFDSIEEQEFHLGMTQERELARMDREIYENLKQSDKESD